MIILVHGPDRATARAAVTSLLHRHDPSDERTSRIDGRSVGLPQLIAQVGTAGFFGSGRVVVVEDLLARAGKAPKGSEPAAGDDAPTTALDLRPVFAAIPAENVVIFVEADLSTIPAAVRKAAPADAEVIAGEPPRGERLVAWLVAAAQQQGATLDPRVARLLAERLYPRTWQSRPANPRYDRPPDMDRLGNEVAKLAAAAHPGSITLAHLEQVVATGENDQIFRFVEAAGRGQLPTALAELDHLIAAGEEPYVVLAQLQGQSELAAVLEAAGPGHDPAGIGRDLGLSNPARMTGIATGRRGQPPGSAASGLASAVATDRATKRGELRQPEDAIYRIVTEAALLAAAGRPGGERR